MSAISAARREPSIVGHDLIIVDRRGMIMKKAKHSDDQSDENEEA